MHIETVEWRTSLYHLVPSSAVLYGTATFNVPSRTGSYYLVPSRSFANGLQKCMGIQREANSFCRMSRVSPLHGKKAGAWPAFYNYRKL